MVFKLPPNHNHLPLIQTAASHNGNARRIWWKIHMVQLNGINLVKYLLVQSLVPTGFGWTEVNQNANIVPYNTDQVANRPRAPRALAPHQLPQGYQLLYAPWSRPGSTETRCIAWTTQNYDRVDVERLSRQVITLATVLKYRPEKFNQLLERSLMIYGNAGRNAHKKQLIWDKHFNPLISVTEESPIVKLSPKQLFNTCDADTPDNKYHGYHARVSEWNYQPKDKNFVELQQYYGDLSRNVVLLDMLVTKEELLEVQNHFPNVPIYYHRKLKFNQHRPSRFQRCLAEWILFFKVIKNLPANSLGSKQLDIWFGGPSRYIKYGWHLRIPELSIYFLQPIVTSRDRNVVEQAQSMTLPMGWQLFQDMEMMRENITCISIDADYYMNTVVHEEIFTRYKVYYPIQKIWPRRDVLTNVDDDYHSTKAYSTYVTTDNGHDSIVEEWIADETGSFKHQNQDYLISTKFLQYGIRFVPKDGSETEPWPLLPINTFLKYYKMMGDKVNEKWEAIYHNGVTCHKLDADSVSALSTNNIRTKHFGFKTVKTGSRSSTPKSQTPKSTVGKGPSCRETCSSCLFKLKEKFSCFNKDEEEDDMYEIWEENDGGCCSRIKKKFKRFEKVDDDSDDEELCYKTLPQVVVEMQSKPVSINPTAPPENKSDHDDSDDDDYYENKETYLVDQEPNQLLAPKPMLPQFLLATSPSPPPPLPNLSLDTTPSPEPPNMPYPVNNTLYSMLNLYGYKRVGMKNMRDRMYVSNEMLYGNKNFNAPRYFIFEQRRIDKIATPLLFQEAVIQSGIYKPISAITEFQRAIIHKVIRSMTTRSITKPTESAIKFRLGKFTINHSVTPSQMQLMVDEIIQALVLQRQYRSAIEIASKKQDETIAATGDKWNDPIKARMKSKKIFGYTVLAEWFFRLHLDIVLTILSILFALFMVMVVDSAKARILCSFFGVCDDKRIVWFRNHAQPVINHGWSFEIVAASTALAVTYLSTENTANFVKIVIGLLIGLYEFGRYYFEELLDIGEGVVDNIKEYFQETASQNHSRNLLAVTDESTAQYGWLILLLIISIMIYVGRAETPPSIVISDLELHPLREFYHFNAGYHYTKSKIIGFCSRYNPIYDLANRSTIVIPEEALIDQCDDKIVGEALGPHSNCIGLVQNGCIHDVVNTTMNRVLLSAQDKDPEAILDDEVFTDFEKFIKTNKVIIFGDKEIGQISKYLRTEWMKRYTGKKLQDKLDHEDRFLQDIMEADPLAAFSVIFGRKNFLKKEEIAKLLTSKFKPRNISQASQQVNSGWGPIMLTLSKFMAYRFGIYIYPEMDDCQRFKGIYYATGMDRRQLSVLMEEAVQSYGGWQVAAYGESDFSIYDVTQCQRVLSVWHFIVVEIMDAMDVDEDERAMIIKILISRATGASGYSYVTGRDASYSHGSVKFSGLDGTRGSGDQDTTLGNTVMQIMVFIWLHAKVFPDDEIGKLRVTSFMLGDDNWFVGKESDIDALLAGMKFWYGKLGLSVKANKGELHLTTFCSGVLLPCAADNKQTMHLTPSIGNLMSRTFINLKTKGMNDLNGKAYARVIAQGALADYGHVPPIHALLKKIISLTEDLSAKRVRRMVNKIDILKSGHQIGDGYGWRGRYEKWDRYSLSPTETTVRLLYARYGIDDEMVNSFVKLIDGLESVFVMFSHPLISRFVLVDSFGMTCDEAGELLSLGIAPVQDDTVPTMKIRSKRLRKFPKIEFLRKEYRLWLSYQKQYYASYVKGLISTYNPKHIM
jgi:hypothetical protein